MNLGHVGYSIFLKKQMIENNLQEYPPLRKYLLFLKLLLRENRDPYSGRDILLLRQFVFYPLPEEYNDVYETEPRN